MRILLAEDDVALNKVLTQILKRNSYTVDSVFNGKDALDYINSGLYDLAVLDIMMPVMDGLTALKQLRDAKNDIPVIMLTAKSELEDRVSGLDTGADDYITKPFKTEELLARIRAVTRRNTPQKTNLPTYGNLSLDVTTYEISVDGKAVKLNHKEFQLMEMLMSSPKSIISADKFMEKIWDVDSNAELSVVWVYISGLRKKLASLNANVTIKASRNIGYYLSPVTENEGL